MICKCDGGGRCPSQGCSANTWRSSRGNTWFNTKTAGNLCLWSIWLVKNRSWLRVMTMWTRPWAPILPWSQAHNYTHPYPLSPSPPLCLASRYCPAWELKILLYVRIIQSKLMYIRKPYRGWCVYRRISDRMCCGRRSPVSLKQPLNLTHGNSDGYLWSGPGRRPTTAKVCVPPTITLYCWTRKQRMPSFNPKTQQTYGRTRKKKKKKRKGVVYAVGWPFLPFLVYHKPLYHCIRFPPDVFLFLWFKKGKYKIGFLEREGWGRVLGGGGDMKPSQDGAMEINWHV